MSKSWEQETADLLKTLCEYNGQECECPICDGALLLEALSADVEKWRKIATDLAESNPQYNSIMNYLAEEYRQGWPL